MHVSNAGSLKFVYVFVWNIFKNRINTILYFTLGVLIRENKLMVYSYIILYKDDFNKLHACSINLPKIHLQT